MPVVKVVFEATMGAFCAGTSMCSTSAGSVAASSPPASMPPALASTAPPAASMREVDASASSGPADWPPVSNEQAPPSAPMSPSKTTRSTLQVYYGRARASSQAGSV